MRLIKSEEALKTTPKLGSLFDGSGGFPLAGSLCGVTPVWAAEVEPYPIAVTRSRFPDMKHLGDISKVNGAEIEPVDIITFGSPCQDLSVAGKRAGLKHEANGDEETTRSGLFMEAVRIIKEMRRATNGLYPTFAVWENVPGAFSSNRGEDFRIVLEELIKIVEPGAVMPSVPQKGWAYADSYLGDGWSLAYRTLDAQYWGVPQRRRRIHLVVDFRGERAREVLFEREGVRGYFAQSRTQGQGSAADAERGLTADDQEGESNCIAFHLLQDPIPNSDVSPCMGQGNSDHGQASIGVAYGWPLGFRPENVRVYEETATTICNGTRPGFTTGVIQPICMATQQGGAEIRTDDKDPTITAAAGMSGNNQPVVCYESAGFKANQGPKAGGIGWQEEMACTLNADRPGLEPTVCIKEQHLFENHDQDARYKGPMDVCPVLPTQLGTGGNNQPFVVEGTKVFRKGTRPHSADEAQKWEEADVANNLNTFDTGESRANELVVEPIPIHDQATHMEPASFYPQMKAESQCFRTDGVAYAVGNGQLNQISMAEQANTLDCMHDQQAVVVFDKEVYNSGESSTGGHYIAEGGPAPSLRTEHPPGVCVRYIVRRLTPTECARLQGFPDNWGHINHKEDFTDEEYSFWLNVRNTHAAINGKTTKEYTKQQMLTWYNKLHTDSAEYKMWGNGIALPTALYCMQGISEVLHKENENEAD